MLLWSASLLSASSIVIVSIPFFNVLFTSYRRCCNKSRGKMRFGVLHIFHPKRAVCNRRINREIPAFVAGVSLHQNYSNFLSYSSAAIRTTKQEPALCTSAPVTGVSSSNRESTIATKLMHIDRVILNLIVFIVALDSRFR